MVLYDDISIRDISWQDCVHVINMKCRGIKKSLRQIEKDTEHLKVRCPVSGEFLIIEGTLDEINALDTAIARLQLYRVI